MVDVAVEIEDPDEKAVDTGWTATATNKADATKKVEAKDGAKLQLPDDDATYTVATVVPDDYLPPADIELAVKDQKADPEKIEIALLAVPVPVELPVSVVGPSDRPVVEAWTVNVSGAKGFGATIDQNTKTVSLPKADTYTFKLTNVGDLHAAPAGGTATAEPVVVTGEEKLTASPASLTWRLSAADPVDKATGPLVNPAAAIMAIIPVGFWSTVLTLKPDEDGFDDEFCWAIGVTGFVALIVGLAWSVVVLLSNLKVLGSWWRIGDQRWSAPWAPVIAVIGAALVLAAFGLAGEIDLTNRERFAIAAGGVTLASFVIGLVRFDTVKAAASLPIVVLFVCLAVWPRASDVMPADVQKAIFYAIGGILGISTLGESVQQWVTTSANAKVKAAEIAAGSATAGASVSRAEGDLTRPRAELTLRPRGPSVQCGSHDSMQLRSGPWCSTVGTVEDDDFRSRPDPPRRLEGI